MQNISIYTDGGCSGNPGPGGWAFVVLDGENERRMSGGEAATTNNRMELTAVISALNLAAGFPDPQTRRISLYTDSQYVKNGITQWINNWVRNGWRTASKQPVKNQDLWQALYEVERRLPVDWFWVKGHAGNPYNELCDSLVQKEMDRFRR